MSVAIALYLELSVVPNVVRPAMVTTAIRAAISPYSMHAYDWSDSAAGAAVIVALDEELSGPAQPPGVH